MPKIIKKFNLTKPTRTIFKYDRSKYWFLRFWVGTSYSKKGVYEKSLRPITIQRDAEIQSKVLVNDFFKSYQPQKTPKDISFQKDIADRYFDLQKKIATNDKEKEKVKKKMKMYEKYIRPIFESVDYRNNDELQESCDELISELTINDLAKNTKKNYKGIVNAMLEKGLKNQNIELTDLPTWKKIDGRVERRIAYEPKEVKRIIDEFLNEYRRTEDMFYQETADYLYMLTSAIFRPGIELLKVKRFQLSYINDTNNPNDPVMKVNLLETKKGEHTRTLADWFTRDVYPRIIRRYPNKTAENYLFFPNHDNRHRLYERIRKNFQRISENLNLYEKGGKKRPLYVIRHSLITKMNKKGVDANVVAIHADTGVEMIKNHYQDMTDDNLLVIHNQLHPRRNRNNEK